MKGGNTIAEQWDELAAAALPPGAHPTQVRESKRMFYAGAGAVLNMQLNVIAQPSVSETAGVAILQGLHEEVALFMGEVMKGAA